MGLQDIKVALSHIEGPRGNSYGDLEWKELEVLLRADSNKLKQADTLVLMTREVIPGNAGYKVGSYWQRNPCADSYENFGAAKISILKTPMTAVDGPNGISMLRPAQEGENVIYTYETLQVAGDGPAYELAQLLLSWGLAGETWSCTLEDK
jgi:hypothetical protein